MAARAGAVLAAAASAAEPLQRIITPERYNWREIAEELGFRFHTIGGDPYWFEGAYYSFTMRQIEDDLETPSEELEEMCFAIVDKALQSEEIMTRLAIPQKHWDYIVDSWVGKAKNLYGRMDFSYNGEGPAKFLEYNADTPTSLYEAGVFQWRWLEDLQADGRLPESADQYNSIHETLIEAFQGFGIDGLLHLTAEAASEEDVGTIEYLADCAEQAGVGTHLLPIDTIGVTDKGQFVDGAEQVISNLFKLYPWEWMFHDEFADNLATSNMRVIEPPWKAVLSNKGLLPLLWELAPGHPNLLPSFFTDAVDADVLGDNYVKKPIYSREGANIEIVENGETTMKADGPYGEEGGIVQALAALPKMDGVYPVLGNWLIASRPAGLGIREDDTPITRDDARFVPHVILD